MKAAEIGFGAPAVDIALREFTERDGGYCLKFPSAGVALDLDRVRRERHELIGELTVSIELRKMATAKSLEDGTLSSGDLNLSSVQARSTRAKLLAERSGTKDIDWHSMIEDFALRIIRAERRGRPAVILAESEASDMDDEAGLWLIEGFPLLRSLPMVLFGDSSSGKSYFAMWLIGRLAQEGINVLYCDWEFDIKEHRKRLGRLFPVMPRNLFYVRCERPLRDEADRITRLAQEKGCQYVVCDSIGFALDGPAESQEASSTYFRALRQLKMGSLNVAHIPKQYDDGREAQIFGSVFFKAGARSVWFIEKAHNSERGTLQFGVYHRKNNLGGLLAPRGYKLSFAQERTTVESVDVRENDELSSKLPLLDRIKRFLKDGAQPLKAIIEDTNASSVSVRQALSRHKSHFIRLGPKYGLSHTGSEPPNTANVVEF